MFRTIWKFVVRPERVADFERHYGSEGTWAQLFRRGRGFIATELYRSNAHANEYITIDVWESEEAYAEFRAENAERYAAVDAEMEELTIAEEKLM